MLSRDLRARRVESQLLLFEPFLGSSGDKNQGVNVAVREVAAIGVKADVPECGGEPEAFLFPSDVAVKFVVQVPRRVVERDINLK